jgi:hypothetical protein
MFVTELETFVQKFHQLWSTGKSAHIDLDTHAGRAWVGLRVQLGHVPGPLHHQLRHPPYPKVHKKKDSPSRQRRRARRAAAQKVNAEEVVDKETDEEKVPSENAEQANESELIPASVKDVVIEAADNVVDEVCSDKEYIPQFDGTYDAEVVYTFVSDFHQEDIEYTIKELIPEDVDTTLVSVVRIGGLQSADQLCTLLIKMPPEKNFIWPIMSKSQSEVIKDLKTAPHFDPA